MYLTMQIDNFTIEMKNMYYKVRGSIYQVKEDFFLPTK